MNEDLTPNLPDVVEEIRVLFERYETALVERDVAVLDSIFWDSPHTIRYAMNEMGYGFDAIHRHRVARKPGPRFKGERRRLEILTLGRRLATGHLDVQVPGSERSGRHTRKS